MAATDGTGVENDVVYRKYGSSEGKAMFFVEGDYEYKVPDLGKHDLVRPTRPWKIMEYSGQKNRQLRVSLASGLRMRMR